MGNGRGKGRWEGEGKREEIERKGIEGEEKATEKRREREIKLVATLYNPESAGTGPTLEPSLLPLDLKIK